MKNQTLKPENMEKLNKVHGGVVLNAAKAASNTTTITPKIPIRHLPDYLESSKGKTIGPL